MDHYLEGRGDKGSDALSHKSILRPDTGKLGVLDNMILLLCYLIRLLDSCTNIITSDSVGLIYSQYLMIRVSLICIAP
jgi:hypothetical protein